MQLLRDYAGLRVDSCHDCGSEKREALDSDVVQKKDECREVDNLQPKRQRISPSSRPPRNWIIGMPHRVENSFEHLAHTQSIKHLRRGNLQRYKLLVCRVHDCLHLHVPT